RRGGECKPLSPGGDSPTSATPFEFMRHDDTVLCARMRTLARLARPTAHEVRGALNALTMHLELLTGSLGADEGAIRERQARHLAVVEEEWRSHQHPPDGFPPLAQVPDGAEDAGTADPVASAIEAVGPLATNRHVELKATPVASAKCAGAGLERWRQ